MAETATFGSILDTPPSEHERPKPIPRGTYRCIIKTRPVFDKSPKKQTEFVQFQLTPLEAGEDVNDKDLNAALTKADGSKKNLSDTSIRATFYLTKDSIYRLKEFLMDDLGITDLETIGYQQAIDQTLNRELLAYVKHRPSDDGKTVYAELGHTAPIEE